LKAFFCEGASGAMGKELKALEDSFGGFKFKLRLLAVLRAVQKG
jgi:hypothetical protein